MIRRVGSLLAVGGYFVFYLYVRINLSASNVRMCDLSIKEDPSFILKSNVIGVVNPREFLVSELTDD